MTLVVAPAGTGKTWLVRSWLARGSSRTAWVSVERGDAEQRFWSAVVRELRTVLPTGVELAPLAPTPRFDPDAVVERLIGELSAVADPVVLVLDGVHRITDAGTSLRLAHLLDTMPPAVHVILISRRDVQLGLHRRRLDGELTEIRNGDLQFTLEETRELVGVREMTLSDAQVRLLYERTEGWVAGLQLAIAALATQPDPAARVGEFSGAERTISEYLVAEFLDHLSPEVRRLLVRTAVLDRVNGALGDLLTGDEGSGGRWQTLADSGAFVVAVDPHRTWFRAHHLLADLLAVRLAQEEPAEVPRLHLVAAEWFADHDLPVEAVRHFQAGGDHGRAAAVLLDHHARLSLDGDQAAAHTLLTAYSQESGPDRPEVTVVLAADELAGGSLEQAAAHLALAAREADRVPEAGRHHFDAALAIARLSLARRRGDFASVLAEAAASDDLREPRVVVDIMVNNDLRTLVLMNRGIVEVWGGLLDAGQVHLEQARELARRGGRAYLEVTCLGHEAHAQSWTDFAGSRQTSRDALALADRHGWSDDPVIVPALVTLGSGFVQAGRLDDGDRWLTRADGLVQADLEPAVGHLLQMSHGAVQIARGQFAEAVASFRRAERLGLRLVGGSPLAVQRTASQLYAVLRSGDIGSVRLSLDQLSDAERDKAEIREIIAAVALADGDPEAALRVLAPTLARSPQGLHPATVVRSLLLQVLAERARGRDREAEQALERALELAERDTLVLPFLFVLPARELEQHRHTAHAALVQNILDAYAGRPGGGDGALVLQPLDALSDTERRLLRYLPTNLTASAIGGQLNVSTNTVKTHLQHIYSKLGVHSRQEAVARARELGLVGASAQQG